jgi:putative ABC transport system permease protein
MRWTNEINEGIRISLAAIRANKLRSSLTTLGIIIGIVTVTLMATAIQGLRNAFQDSVSTMGADVFYVQRFSWFMHSHAEWLKVQNRQPITLAQVKALKSQMTLARAIAPWADTRRPVSYKNRSASGVMVFGTTEEYLDTGNTAMGQGRFISGPESDGGRPVCVIGYLVATNLFPRETAIGKKIMIGTGNFEVIGILEKQGSFLGQFSLDNQVIVPLKQFVSNFRSFPDFNIRVRAFSLTQMDEAQEELRGLLRKIRKVPALSDDDFAINRQEMFIQTFNKVAGSIATAGLFITGLSLFVGGIGIMNIMFVSVAERTREIGIRKAIGAKRRAILMQFLTEAATICLLGGLIGLSIAWPATLFMKRFMPATMSPLIVALAIGVSLITGLLSGFFPAWRAARMNPVDALRNE